MGDGKVLCREVKELTKEVGVMFGQVRSIEKQIDGNGAHGIAHKVEEHESYIDKQKGSLSMLKILVFLSLSQGVGVIGLALKIFKVI